jgi:F0F1-type ATP synthase assembly protein I
MGQVTRVKNVFWLLATLAVAVGVAWVGAMLGWVIEYSLTDCEYLCIHGLILGGVTGFFVVLAGSAWLWVGSRRPTPAAADRAAQLDRDEDETLTELPGG